MLPVAEGLNTNENYNIQITLRAGIYHDIKCPATVILPTFSKLNFVGSLVPRLSPRANEKSKERGEPGRIYHVRNVIGRENLITCGRTNELAHAVRTEDSRDSFMADRM